jgi:alanine dehydrogenase
MPGAVARTGTLALTNTTLPFGLELAGKGLERAIRENEHLRRGVNTYKGACTYEGVAEAFGLEYSDVTGLI